MTLLSMMIMSVCLSWTYFINSADEIGVLTEEDSSALRADKYLKDSLKISATVSKENVRHLMVKFENHGKKFIRIGRIYGLQTFVDDTWTYLTKAEKESSQIPPDSVITIMYNLCVERIRNNKIGYTYSVNRKNRIKLDIYDNKGFIGKISSNFMVPVNMVWNKKEGLILIQYD